jgi:hypothetical protein
MVAFWDTVPCRLAEVDRRFTDAYRLHHHADEAVLTSETSVYFCKSTQRCIPQGAILSDLLPKNPKCDLRFVGNFLQLHCAVVEAISGSI